MAVGDRSLTVNGRFALSGNYSLERAAGGTNVGAWTAALTQLALTSGTTDGKADRLWTPTAQTVDATGTTWDLTSLTDDYGSISFAEIRGMWLYNGSAAGGANLIFGAAATFPFVGWLGGTAPTITLKPGENLLRWGAADGAYPITNSSNDNLKLAANSGTCTFQMLIWGTSA